MNKALMALAVALAVVGGGLWYATREVTGKMPQETVRKMKFPRGLDVKGDKTGNVCHQIYYRPGNGNPDVLLKSHIITGKDWAAATEEQRKKWIVDDTVADMGEEGLACAPDSWFLRSAYADPPYCPDCGSDCSLWSCSGRMIGSNCMVGGTQCVVTVICCAPSFCEPPC